MEMNIFNFRLKSIASISIINQRLWLLQVIMEQFMCLTLKNQNQKNRACKYYPSTSQVIGHFVNSQFLPVHALALYHLEMKTTTRLL